MGVFVKKVVLALKQIFSTDKKLHWQIKQTSKLFHLFRFLVILMFYGVQYSECPSCQSFISDSDFFFKDVWSFFSVTVLALKIKTYLYPSADVELRSLTDLYSGVRWKSLLSMIWCNYNTSSLVEDFIQPTSEDLFEHEPKINCGAEAPDKQLK